MAVVYTKELLFSSIGHFCYTMLCILLELIILLYDNKNLNKVLRLNMISNEYETTQWTHNLY